MTPARRHRPALLVAACAALVGAVVAAGSAGAATPKAGAACTKPGQSAVASGGRRLVCNRSGARLVWVAVPGGSDQGGSSAGSQPKAGAVCTKAGLSAGGGAGITLSCTKVGAKLVWQAQKGALPAAGGSQPAGGSQAGAGAQASSFPWSPGPDGWTAAGTPPACGSLGWTLPADISGATAVLPPGQVRGGNYKAHGGFRFDSRADGLLTVVSPIDGILYRGAAYLEDDFTKPTGRPDVQYLLDIVNPCGFMVRFDHLRTLAPAIKAVFDANVKTSGSSATTPLPAVAVKAGQAIATEIGHRDTGLNISFDLGVYDLRKKQTTTRSAAEIQSLGSSTELAWYGVCWYDLFGSAAAGRIRALPAAGGNSASDFCNRVEIAHEPDPAQAR